MMLLPFEYRKKLKFIRYYHNIIKKICDIQELMYGNLNELKHVQNYLDADENNILNIFQSIQVQKNVAVTLLLSLISYNFKEIKNKLYDLEIVKILDIDNEYYKLLLICIEHETDDIINSYSMVSNYIN